MTREEKGKGKKKMRTNGSDNLSHGEHMPITQEERKESKGSEDTRHR